MRIVHGVIALLSTVGCILASAEGSQAPQPGPFPTRPNAPMSTGMQRPMSVEMEIVIMTLGADGNPDRAALTRLTELGAEGFHTVSVVAWPGRHVVYLERPVVAGVQAVRLPALLEQDPATADALRARLQQTTSQRMSSVMPRPIGPVPSTGATAAPIAR